MEDNHATQQQGWHERTSGMQGSLATLIRHTSAPAVSEAACSRSKQQLIAPRHLQQEQRQHQQRSVGTLEFSAAASNAKHYVHQDDIQSSNQQNGTVSSGSLAGAQVYTDDAFGTALAVRAGQQRQQAQLHTRLAFAEISPGRSNRQVSSSHNAF